MSEKISYLACVSAYFEAHPNQEISCYDLEKVGGHNGWRTRVSECRRKLGMDISQPRHARDAQTGVRTTFYRYTPPFSLSAEDATRADVVAGAL